MKTFFLVVLGGLIFTAFIVVGIPIIFGFESIEAQAQSQSSFERELVQAEQRQARALEEIAQELRRLRK